jgi:hypothetical protein
MSWVFGFQIVAFFNSLYQFWWESRIVDCFHDQ